MRQAPAPTAEAWHAGLTERQRKFCEAYSSNGGNAIAAARIAGYAHPLPQGAQNLSKPTVARALDLLRKSITDKAIATREERQRFWTSMLRDTSIEPKDRLKASELLGRSQADFLDRVDATTRIIVEHVGETIDGEFSRDDG